jgi:hypothetical protein
MSIEKEGTSRRLNLIVRKGTGEIETPKRNLHRRAEEMKEGRCGFCER